MNQIYVIIIGFLVSMNCQAMTKNRNSRELSECKQLALQFQSSRLHEDGGGLPDSWNDFITVSNALEGKSKIDPYQMETINSFALVPGHPIIKSHPQIPREFIGCSLLTINRKEKFAEEYGEKGRYAILVGNPTKSSDAMPPLLSYFIPAEAARAILDQMPDFDPSTQPLAFEPEFIAKVERELKQKDENWREAAESNYRELAARERKDHPVRSLLHQKKSVMRLVWMAVGLLVLAVAGLFGYSALRRRKG